MPNGSVVESESEGPSLIGIDFKPYANLLVITAFMLCVAVVKVMYSRLFIISHHLPESCMLIVSGIIVAYIIKTVMNGIPKNLVLTPELFFRILLPPIVLESAYCLYDQTFASLLTIVLIFAVIGTVCNFFMIGAGLYLFDTFNLLGKPILKLQLKPILLFSALIVAVDPVAVLAIFNDIGVDLELYFIVFGESLLNDAVTVVLYDIIKAFMTKDTVEPLEIVIGFFSFFTVSLGGFSVGLVFGALSCIMIRPESHYQYLILIIMAYIAYIFAMALEWSGIISMIGCGLVQARYGFHSMDNDSVHMLRNVTESLATISEAMIFFFLGTALFDRHLYWHTGFCLVSLLLCIVSRFAFTVILSSFINFFRINNRFVTITEQFVLFYGGLRGAVSFSLCVLIDPAIMTGQNEAEKKRNTELLFTSTMFIIMVTVGFMGTTMKPLVKLLNIRMSSQDEHSTKLLVHATLRSIEQVEDAVKIIAGFLQESSFKAWFSNFDEKYIKPVLTSEVKRNLSLLDKYAQLTLEAGNIRNSNYKPFRVASSSSANYNPDFDINDCQSMFQGRKTVNVLNVREIGSFQEHNANLNLAHKKKLLQNPDMKKSLYGDAARGGTTVVNYLDIHFDDDLRYSMQSLNPPLNTQTPIKPFPPKQYPTRYHIKK